MKTEVDSNGRSEPRAFLNDASLRGHGSSESMKTYESVFAESPASSFYEFPSFMGQDESSEPLLGIPSNFNPEYKKKTDGLFLPSEMGVPLAIPSTKGILSTTSLMDPVAYIPPKTTQTCVSCPLYPTPSTHSCYGCQDPSLLRGGDDPFFFSGEFKEGQSDEAKRIAEYGNMLKLTSLSIKVFNCTPTVLPSSLRCELLKAVKNSSKTPVMEENGAGPRRLGS